MSFIFNGVTYPLTKICVYFPAGKCQCEPCNKIALRHAGFCINFCEGKCDAENCPYVHLIKLNDSYWQCYINDNDETSATAKKGFKLITFMFMNQTAWSILWANKNAAKATADLAEQEKARIAEKKQATAITLDQVIAAEKAKKDGKQVETGPSVWKTAVSKKDKKAEVRQQSAPVIVYAESKQSKTQLKKAVTGPVVNDEFTTGILTKEAAEKAEKNPLFVEIIKSARVIMANLEKLFAEGKLTTAMILELVPIFDVVNMRVDGFAQRLFEMLHVIQKKEDAEKAAAEKAAAEKAAAEKAAADKALSEMTSTLLSTLSAEIVAKPFAKAVKPDEKNNWNNEDEMNFDDPLVFKK